MPSTVEIACIDPARVREIWPHVEQLLKAAIDRTGLSAWRPIAADILDGRSLLWISVGNGKILCAAATSLQKTDSGKVCVITACGGTEMPRWIGLLEKVESYAAAEGCRCVRIFGRKGWKRVLDGYRARHVVLEKELS